MSNRSRAALDYSARTIKIYSSAYDATARADIDAHLADVANPHAVTKAQVGLGAVDNTSDAAKPVSDPQAAALALKAPLASPALTGTPTAPTALLGTISGQIATTEFVQTAVNALDIPDVTGDLAAHLADTTNPHVVTKAQVGLGNADNTADVDKPVSAATQIALNAGTAATDAVASDLATHLADVSNPHSVTKAQVGLGNVDNTSDAAKPVSSATQAALNSAAADTATVAGDLADHLADVANPHAVTKAQVGLGAVDNTADLNKPVSSPQQTAINVATAAAAAAQSDIDTHQADTSNPHAVTKAQVGLGLVDNTADLDKPVSTATQAAINAATGDVAAVEADLAAHLADVSNPHAVTKAQVGLGAVDNTADADKPVSSATQIALNLKAPLASPVLTGVPAAPTASPGTNTTQIATTAFVAASVGADLAAHLADTANPHAVTKAQVGLGLVDNTADADKPVSTATQLALDLKAPLASPPLTGTPTAPTAAAGTNTTQLATTAYAKEGDLAGRVAERPGDAVGYYGASKTGEAIAATPIDAAWVTTSPAGRVVRINAATAADPQTIATVAAFPVEPERVYELRWKVQRQTDPADPLNDSVVVGIQWLTNSKADNGIATVENIPLTIAMGIEERLIRIAGVGGGEVDLIAPAGTVYCRPFVDCYGDSHITDVIVIERRDATFETRATVETLSGLGAVVVPTGARGVLVQRYNEFSLDAPAWYDRVEADPGVPMSGQDATGNWFVLATDPATPEMAGALGDDTGNDAPAFSRLLQSGNRVIRARTGATYRIAQEGTTRKAMHNNGIGFDHITLDLSGARIVLEADAGVDAYADQLSIIGAFGRFVLIGGIFEYSTPPYIYGTITAIGVGTTADDAWYEFRRAPNLSHPGWTDQSIRTVDHYEAGTRELLGRVFGRFHSAVTGSSEPAAPGFPMTRPDPTGNPDLYRVDLRNCVPDLATALEGRDSLSVGEYVAMQHRRDLVTGVRIGGQLALQRGGYFECYDTIIHHNMGTGFRFDAVTGAQLVRTKVIPKNTGDFFSTNPDAYRLQDCRGTWTFDNCVAIRAGDDAFAAYGTSSRILDTPTTDPTLLPTQLRLIAIFNHERGKPLPGEVVQLRDWTTGTVDESDIWTAQTVEAGTEYVITLDKNVNPAWTPTGGEIVDNDPNDGLPGSWVGDGTGWVLDTMAAPLIIWRGGRLEENRNSGWVISHVAEGSRFNIDWAIDNTRDACFIGNAYPASLNGRLPRDIDVTVGLVSGRNTGFASGLDIGGYAGNTRALAAAEGYVRDVRATVDVLRDMPKMAVEMGGVTRGAVRVGSMSNIAFRFDQTDDHSYDFRSIVADNIGDCIFDGDAIGALSHFDVLINGTSHDNTIVSPARARNWLDNVEYLRISRGTSIAIANQAATFDRWLAEQIGGGLTVSRQPGFGNDKYCMRVQRNAGSINDNLIVIGQQLPTRYIRELRGKRLLLYLRVRAGANFAGLQSGINLGSRALTGTVEGEIWDLSDAVTGGFTGGVAHIIVPVPYVVPTVDGAIHDFVTVPFVVPNDAAAMALRITWSSPAIAAGAADYLEFSPWHFVVVGDGFNAENPNVEDNDILTGQLTVTPGSLADGAGTTADIAVPGAVLGDFVEAVSFSLDLQGTLLTGYVQAVDVVRCRFQNETGALINLASGTLRVRVRHVG